MSRLLYTLRRWFLAWQDARAQDYVSAEWLADYHQQATRSVAWRETPRWKWPVEWN